MTSTEQKRVHPRYDLVAPVEFERPNVSGETRNISFGGIAFYVPAANELPLGQMVRFTVKLDGKEPLTLSANLCWRAGEMCGVAFERLDRAQRLAVEALVEERAAVADTAA